MTQEKVDSATLADITNEVFWLSMDDRFTPEQRSELLIIGKKLRGALLNLITAKFEENTKALVEANSELDGVNTMIKEEIDDLEDKVEVIERLTALIGVLDKLLGAAASFF